MGIVEAHCVELWHLVVSGKRMWRCLEIVKEVGEPFAQKGGFERVCQVRIIGSSDADVVVRAVAGVVQEVMQQELGGSEVRMHHSAATYSSAIRIPYWSIKTHQPPIVRIYAYGFRNTHSGAQDHKAKGMPAPAILDSAVCNDDVHCNP